MSITVKDCRNPRFASATENLVDVEILTEEFGWIETTLDLTAQESEDHIIKAKELLASLLIAPYVDPKTTAEYITEAKTLRDKKIEDVMWRIQRYESEVRLGMTPTDDLVALDGYVQLLRDVPLQAGFPMTINWPVEP